MKIVNRNDAAIINTPHGSEIRPLMDRTTSDIELCSLAEEVLPVGASVGRHHHHETEEVYYILKGTGSMEVGDELREVKAGRCDLYSPGPETPSDEQRNRTDGAVIGLRAGLSTSRSSDGTLRG